MAQKILIVDDDRLNTTLIKFGLKQAGFDVMAAEDGHLALEAVKSFLPDLIVLDIHMPKMSGFEFMTELKSIPRLDEVPVIMLTSNDSLRDLFLSEGVKGYFVKPVDPAKLEAKIKECLGDGGAR